MPLGHIGTTLRAFAAMSLLLQSLNVEKGDRGLFNVLECLLFWSGQNELAPMVWDV